MWSHTVLPRCDGQDCVWQDFREHHTLASYDCHHRLILTGEYSQGLYCVTLSLTCCHYCQSSSHTDWWIQPGILLCDTVTDLLSLLSIIVSYWLVNTSRDSTVWYYHWFAVIIVDHHLILICRIVLRDTVTDLLWLLLIIISYWLVGLHCGDTVTELL